MAESTNGTLQSPEELWQQDSPFLLWLLVNQHHYGFVDSVVSVSCWAQTVLGVTRFFWTFAKHVARLSPAFTSHCIAFNLEKQRERQPLLVPIYFTSLVLLEVLITKNVSRVRLLSLHLILHIKTISGEGWWNLIQNLAFAVSLLFLPRTEGWHQ